MGIGVAREGIDYQLIPATDDERDQSWDIRIIKGEFTETVLRFGNIAFDGENDCLNFNFMIVSTPDTELTEANVALQDRAAEVLASVLEEAAQTGSLQLGNPDDDSED